MNKWKKILSLTLAGAMMLSLAACGGSGAGDAKEPESNGSKEASEEAESTEKVTLNILFNDTDENVEAEMEYVMEHLPERLPNVEAKLEMVPGDAQTYETKVRTMISAGGEGLDVWWERGGSWATPILESGSALPLDEYLEESGYKDKVIPSAIFTAEDGQPSLSLPIVPTSLSATSASLSTTPCI